MGKKVETLLVRLAISSDRVIRSKMVCVLG